MTANLALPHGGFLGSLPPATLRKKGGKSGTLGSPSKIIPFVNRKSSVSVSEPIREGFNEKSIGNTAQRAQRKAMSAVQVV